MKMAETGDSFNPMHGGDKASGKDLKKTFETTTKQTRRASVRVGSRNAAEHADDYTDEVVISGEWVANPGGSDMMRVEQNSQMNVDEAKKMEYDIDPKNPKNMARHLRLVQVDRAARDLLPIVDIEAGGGDKEEDEYHSWSAQCAGENEIKVFSIKCIQFTNCPAGAGKVKDGEPQVGKGLIVLTKKEETGKYRLHYFMKHREACFKAREKYQVASASTSTLVGSSSSNLYVEVENDYDSKHQSSLSYAILSTGGPDLKHRNLYHVHAYLEDSSNVVVKQKATLEESHKYEVECCPGVKCDQLICWIRFCKNSCPIQCASQQEMNSEGVWAATTSYEDSISREINEHTYEEQDDVEIHHELEHREKSPYTHPVKGSQETESKVQKMHGIVIVYRDTRFKTITSKVIISPEEPTTKVLQFTSLLQELITEDGGGDFTLPNEGGAMGVQASFASMNMEVGVDTSVKFIGWTSVVTSFFSMIMSFVSANVADDSSATTCASTGSTATGQGILSLIAFSYKIIDLMRKGGMKVNLQLFLVGDALIGFVTFVIGCVFAASYGECAASKQNSWDDDDYDGGASVFSGAVAVGFLEAAMFAGGAANKYRVMMQKK